MTRPALVLVGGFLGAGKTSLILAAARVLAGRGMRSAAILNDQGEDLVDTRLAKRAGIAAGQVTGGCFCCRLSDLIDAAEQLESHAPHVIFAEVVGSCTDVVATVIRPLQRDFAHRFRIAPLTVLVDPGRDHADPDLDFLFQHQVAEADLVVASKADLGAASNGRHLSARTGEGVVAWLDEILSGEIAAGTRQIDIDYERYAQAEATLGWLNCRALVSLPVPLSPAMLIGPLLERLDEGLEAARVQISHLKVLDECPSGYLKAAICASGQEPEVEGALDTSPESEHDLLVNLRAAGDPARLRSVVESAIGSVPGKVDLRAMQSFRPGPPNRPTS